MLKFLKSWFSKTYLAKEVMLTVVKATTNPTAKDYIMRNTCPVCGNEGFLAGASGGMTQNIQCADSKCGAWFNVAAGGGQLLWVELIKGTQLPQGMKLE